MPDTDFTVEEVDTASTALICVTNVVAGEIGALLGSVALSKALDEGKWEETARTMRKTLVVIQAKRVENGVCSEEEMEHWQKHAKQLVEVLGAE